MTLDKKKTTSKKIHVTFSIPEDVNRLLHSTVEKRGLSEFVTKALKKALDEETDLLKKAYASASEDADRNKTVEEWSDLEVEGWDE